MMTTRLRFYNGERWTDDYLENAVAPSLLAPQATQAPASLGSVRSRNVLQRIVAFAWSSARWWALGWRGIYRVDARASQSEFWAFISLNTALVVAVAYAQDAASAETGAISGTVYVVWLITAVLAAIRRAHDTGRSAGSLVGFPGIFWAGRVLSILGEQGSRRSNEFGQPPEVIKIRLPPPRPQDRTPDVPPEPPRVL